MASPRIAESAQEKMCPATGQKRRLKLIYEEPFHCYACSWCGSRFPIDDAPNGLTMFQILHLYRAQREKRFSEHVCSERLRITEGFDRIGGERESPDGGFQRDQVGQSRLGDGRFSFAEIRDDSRIKIEADHLVPRRRGASP